VLNAIAREDWDAVRARLHPYLHWNGADGTRLRGRTTVIAMLKANPPSAAPSWCELRDGQIYRWHS
jgi:hypothetical protein